MTEKIVMTKSGAATAAFTDAPNLFCGKMDVVLLGVYATLTRLGEVAHIVM